MTEPPQRFRGAVARYESSRGAGIGSCEVTPTTLRLTSPLRGEFELARSEVRAVVFDRQRGPFNWRTVVRFSAGSTQYPMLFIPWRPKRLRAALDEFGWPIADE